MSKRLSSGTFADVDWSAKLSSSRTACFAIVGGRGAGQFRTVKEIGCDSITITKPWGIVPNATSSYSLIIPNHHMTIYRNTIRDCGATLCIYGNEFDVVIAENSIRNSGGISTFFWSMPDKARGNPGRFVRVDRNLLEDIFVGKRKANNISGVHGFYTGNYVGPAGLGFEFRRNVFRKLKGAEAHGLMINISGAKPGKTYLKGVLIEHNSIEHVAKGLDLGRGVSGLVFKDNRLVQTGVAIDGDGKQQAIILGNNHASGEGAGWTQLDDIGLTENGQFRGLNSQPRADDRTER